MQVKEQQRVSGTPVMGVETFSQIIIQLNSGLCTHPPPSNLGIIRNYLIAHFLWYTSSVTEKADIGKEFEIS